MAPPMSHRRRSILHEVVEALMTLWNVVEDVPDQPEGLPDRAESLRDGAEVQVRPVDQHPLVLEHNIMLFHQKTEMYQSIIPHLFLAHSFWM